MLDRRKKIVDANLILRASAVLSTASYATYGAATPKTIDLGGDGYTEGKLVIDVSSFNDVVATVASGVVYDFILRGSNLASFDAGYVPLARFRLGTAFAVESIKDSGRLSTVATPTTGRYVVPWTNDFGGTTYQYLRLRILFGGTFLTGPVLGMIFLTKE